MSPYSSRTLTARIDRWWPDVTAGLAHLYPADVAKATAARLEPLVRAAFEARAEELHELDYRAELRAAFVRGVTAARRSLPEPERDVLADTIRPNFYGPAGYSLKQLAPAAGAHWRTPGATGADTYAWIDAARSGDQSAWNTLTGYNEDDVRALRALRAAIAGMRAPGSTLDLAPA